MGKLEGKVCIITGGGTGIGRGTARAFAKEGATLVLAARQVDRLNESAEEMRGYGVPALAVQTDVTSEEQVMRLFETTMEEYGRLDILVNNSGAFDGGPIDEIPLGYVDEGHQREPHGRVPLHEGSDEDHEAAEERTDHQHRQHLVADAEDELGPLHHLQARDHRPHEVDGARRQGVSASQRVRCTRETSRWSGARPAPGPRTRSR